MNSIKKYFLIHFLLIFCINQITIGQIKIDTILELVRKSGPQKINLKTKTSNEYSGFDFSNFTETKNRGEGNERFKVYSDSSFIKLIRWYLDSTIVEFCEIIEIGDYKIYTAFIYSNYKIKTGNYINGYFLWDKNRKKNFLFLFNYDVNTFLVTDSKSKYIKGTYKSEILIESAYTKLTQDKLIAIFELDKELKPIRRLNIFNKQIISSSKIVYEDFMIKEVINICAFDGKEFKGVNLDEFNVDFIDDLFLEPSIFYYQCFITTATRRLRATNDTYKFWLNNNIWYE